VGFPLEIADKLDWVSHH